MGRVSCSVLLALLAVCSAKVLKTPYPPRGWNSWDCFGNTNETMTLAIANAMAATVADEDYVYLTIDAGWFGHSTVNIDEFGRPIADPQQFPASVKGNLSYLSDAIHAKGLKFGLWYMAGVPAQSVQANSPIKGTSFNVQDIVVKDATYCARWDPGWGYQVNHDHPAAQAWYNSLAELWASWGVDYIKLDCVNAEDELANHRLDIIYLFNAFESLDHDFVFSLSPGGHSNISQILGIRPYVTMARATDDFWDDWDAFMSSPGGSGYSHWDAARDLVGAVRNVQPTYWIDLDMLPFGRVGQPGNPCSSSGSGCPRQSRFTFQEQQTIFTLWSLVQSPLILGADLTVLDNTTSSLVNNDNLRAMTQDIEMSWEAYRTADSFSGTIVWQATSKTSSSQSYVSIFNLNNSTQTLSVPWSAIGLTPVPSRTLVTNLWTSSSIPVSSDGLQVNLPAHGCFLAMVNL